MGAGAYQIVQFSKLGRSNVGKFDGKKEEDNDNEKGPRSKAPSSVTFGTKEDPRLMKYAKETFEGYEQLRNEATSLIEQMKAGNFSGGSGSHGIGQGIFELRSRNGVRVYFRNIGDAVAILGYSKKANQPEVISKLFELYGK